MPAGAWLQRSIRALEIAGIGTARLDCLVLLEDASGYDRGWLLAHPEYELSDKQVNRLKGQINRRINHEPLAYIRGKTEFYGREFLIDERVLEPRPESEAMIDLLKALLLNSRKSTRAKGGAQYIIDVGTGSGALAVTAVLELMPALEHSGISVFATDIDSGCLQVARQNAAMYKTSIQFWHGDLITPLSEETIDSSLLLANLPYVPDDHQINQAAANEPRRAIFGGQDGLDVYRSLFRQIDQLSVSPKHILTESLPYQHAKLAEIAQTSGYRLMQSDDFIQVFES